MDGEGRGDVGGAFLEALFVQAPVGLYMLDRELRVVRFNRAGRGVRGLAAESVVGRTPAELAPGLEADALAAVLRQVLQTGQTVQNRVFRGAPPNDPSGGMAVSITAFRLSDPSGRVLGVAGVVQDVTEREAALERLELYNDANRLIGSTLEVATTARELAELGVPRFADAVMVDLVDEVMRGDLPPAGPRDARTVLRRAAHRTRKGWAPSVESAGGLAQPYPPSYLRALTGTAPVLLERLEAGDDWPGPAQGPWHQLPKGAHSLLVAPLVVQRTVLGVACFVRAADARRFTSGDRDVAAALCARTAYAMDKALAYARERDIATALQRHLLPRAAPHLSAVDCAHVHHSGTQAADWFDVIPLPGARVALVIGTVAGRGIETAAAMGQLRTAVQTLAAQDLPPDELLTRLDEATQLLAAQTANDPEHEPRRSAASCLYLLYDPTSRRCTAASAGHPPPITLGPDSSPIAFPVPVGPFLGQGGPFESITTELPPNTLLALHTAGLAPGSGAKARAHRDRLLGALTYPGPSLEQLCQAASSLLPPLPAEDRTLLLARTHALAPDRVAHWTLSPDPSVVSTARGLAHRQLAAWHLEEMQDTTELIVSELVTNAIRYGSGPISVRLILDRGLTCEVSDASSTAPHLRRAHENDEGGRGLFLVLHCSRRWGTRYEPNAKTIWAEQDIPSTATNERATRPADARE